MRFKTLIGMTLALMLAGCAGTSSKVVDSYSFNTADRFAIEIVNTANATKNGLDVLQKQLDEADLNVDDVNPTRLVSIEITRYRFRSGGTRAMVGILAGTDNMTTVTTVTDKETGAELGRAEHVTKNATAVVGSNSLLRGHVDKIVAFLLSDGGASS